MQDLLGLGTESRMNLPGRTGGYWQWRLTDEQLQQADGAWLARLSLLYGRV
jgi:4-alpha-glucanotransferase